MQKSRPHRGPEVSRCSIGLTALLFFSSLLTSNSALSLSFTSFDTRSMALGGAGVAFARPVKAPLFNPALLSVGASDGAEPLMLSLHSGARLFDRDGFIDGVRHYQDNNAEAAFESALADFNGKVDQGLLEAADFDALSMAANELFDDIEGLSNRPLRLGGAIGATLARPGDTGLAGFVHVYAIGGSIIDFAATDRALVDGVLNFGRATLDLTDTFAPYVDFLEQNVGALQASYEVGGFTALELELRNLLANSNLAPDAEALISLLQNYHQVYLAGAVEIDDVRDLIRLPDFRTESRSELELQGALVTEAGFSFSKQFHTWQGLSAGATVKVIQFQTVDYRARIVDATGANFAFRDHRTVFSDPNIDLGLAGILSGNLRWGIVIRNLLERDYVTARGNIIELRPQARIGFAWETDKITLAADLDLTRNEPLGFDPDKRFLGLGIERRWSRWSLRAGLRHNIVDNTELYSLGLAVRMGRTQLEVSGAGTDDTAALALQFDVRF